MRTFAHMRKVLILGGTRFIGRVLVDRLQGMDDFELTLFNRGQTGGDLFPGIGRIVGDRSTKDIDQIASTNWDVVVDLSCYFPGDLERVLSNLSGTPEKYVLISTCSVYDASETTVLRDEEATIVGCTRQQYADPSPASYGNRKAECERVLQRSGLDHVIFRPAMVYGPYDPTDRLYYWLHQVKFKEELLIPDQGERRFSMTYVHDLVDAIVRSMQEPLRSSVYNVITIPEVSIGAIVRETCTLLGRSVPAFNASPEFLKQNQVGPWVDMPLWLDGDHFTYSNLRLKRDLVWEPSDLKKSLERTLAYYDERGWQQPTYGMQEERRIELLEKCKLVG